jgi:pyridoxine 5-phosphate synthase
MRELTVCLDALAVLAERTRPRDPDLVAAATLAELAGADTVRIGVNEDFRPVRERDLRDLRRATRTLELRMAPAPGLVKVALEAQPDRVLLASESRDGEARPGPLDLRTWGGGLAPAVRTLQEAGFPVAVLVKADLEAVKASHAASAAGVELHTAVGVDLPPAERVADLERLANASRLAAKLRMAVSLGGGLGYRNLGEVLAQIPAAGRVAVGRAWTWRSALVGIERATRDLRERIG